MAPVLVLCAVLSCLILVIGFYFLSAKNRNPPFEKVKLTRLTNNGKVSAVTLSPDGKIIAYVLNEAEGNSLWIRQTGTANDTRIMPPIKPLFRSLTFTPDGTQLYYSLFSSDRPDFEFYRIPILGGVSQKLPGIIAHSISFSPDGKHFAFIQPDSEAGKSYLVIADADGTNQRVIAQKPQPNTFVSEGDFTAWSPDGETIACLVDHLEAESNYTSIVGINPKDGTERPLSEEKWYDAATFAWVKDGSGLIVAGSEKISSKNQLWFLPQPAGEIRPLTENSNNYGSISTSADSNSFIALQTESVNGISVGAADGEEATFKEIVSEVGDLFPLTWTAGGKIIFRSSADGNPNLWMVDPDGTNRHQLTIDANATERAMCTTPDGKFIVFVSWRSGRSNLWRVNTDGSDLTPLTSGEADAYPACMPDSQTIVYQRGILTSPHLWKVSINDGEPVQLTDFWAKWAAISTDGRQVSFFQMSRDKWHIGLISSTGSPILRLLDVPVMLKESPTQWSSDDKSLFFIGTIGSVGNVWSLPLDGGEPKPITNFKSHYMEDFAMSPDGAKLAVLRSTELSDVVLVEKVR